MADGIQAFADWLFLPYVIALLLGGGLFLSFRTGFVQVRRFGDGLRAMVAQSSKGASGALTPFQSFMTALAASIGTGNIAGVATAIVSGGPGALFWIWVYGFLATSIKFSEAVLGVKYRVFTDRAGAQGTPAVQEDVKCGPMYYLREVKWGAFPKIGAALAWTYALVAGVAALTTTPFTQPNSIGVAVNYVMPTGTITLPVIGAVQQTALFTGLVVAVLTWAVIIRGIKSIGRAAESLAPLKVGLYLIGGLIVIVSFAGQIPSVLKLVVTEALSLRSGLGFGLFVAMRYGIARGVYANEAGYGTAAVAYGTAKSTDPSQQGMQAVMEVFIVSFVTATISAMTILLTGVWNAGPTSTAAVASAFNMAIPTGGGYIVALCAFLFGLTTLIGWAYYGEQFLEYILGRSVTVPYRWIYCLLIPFGAIAKPTVVWAWGDLMNALQVFPNMIGLVVLSAVAAKYARKAQV